MDINQKFFDDVIITMMEMNDRLVALEEMAAEHVAEHESAIDAFEDGFAAGESRSLTRLKYANEMLKPALGSVIGIDENGYFIDPEKTKPAPEEMINITEEYHYQDGKIHKKMFLDFPEEKITDAELIDRMKASDNINLVNSLAKILKILDKYNAGEIA